MSHVRNLHHKSYVAAPSPAPVTVPPEFTGESPIQQLGPNGAVAAAIPGEASILADCPVERAQIRPEQRLVFYTDPHNPAADRFRYLRMRLREGRNAGKLKTVLITSPLSQDGKSTTILNLATALAERGRRAVLLIEADLHKSCIAERLGLKTWAGMAECLQDVHRDPLAAIRRVDPLEWYLLPAGGPAKNPTELLQTPAFATIMQRVAPHFDWILIDSPPAVPLTDAISLQQHADGSLLVVRAGSTPREAVEHTTELLGSKKIFGIVLNGIEAHHHLYSRYHQY
jgi:capsular exopolysaccharide synthesis family protein